MKKTFKKIVAKFFFLIFAALAVFAAVSCYKLKIGFGEGTGTSKTQKIKTVVIEVSDTEITINKKTCKDVAELQKKINEIHSANPETQFVLKDNYAIKSVYNQVQKTLNSCQKSLGIVFIEE